MKKSNELFRDLIGNLKEKKVVIWGLGLNFGGLEATKFFAQIKGTKVLVLDSKKPQDLKESVDKLKKYKNVRFILGRNQEKKDFKGADIIIKNHAIYWQNNLVKELKKEGYRIETDITLFFRFFRGKIVGVTGSKGKTTTTTLIGKFLKAGGKDVLLGGNIRVSLFSFFKSKFLENQNKIAVLELSSFQLEDLLYIRRSPEISVITNILRDHLNRYGTLEKYFNAKKNIYAFQKKGDYLILNKNDKRLEKIKDKKLPSTIIRVSGEEKAGFKIKNPLFKRPFNRQSLNISMVVSGDVFKISKKTLKKTIESFKGVPYRLEKIAVVEGIEFYNDTTATIPDATIGSLQNFNQKVILISGGSDKNLKFDEFGKEVAKKAKKVILLPGNITTVIKKSIKKYSSHLSCKEVKNMREGVLEACKNAKKGDIILLSPGCTSFGLFKNEFDRGDQFNEIVNELKSYQRIFK